MYALVAYRVAQRTREIGVRLASGATPSRIVAGIVRHGSDWRARGSRSGSGRRMPLSRFMQGILSDVAATDARTYIAVAALLAGCATAASLLPARWGARLDPVRALRDE